MKTMFAGPWIGEFGWCVMAFQGYLRKIAKNYDRVIVSGPTGHSGMYEFADVYLNFDCDSTEANMWLNPKYEKQADEFYKMFAETHPSHIDRIDPMVVWEEMITLDKEQIVGKVNWEFKGGNQIFKRFGNGQGPDFDILYHARQRHDWDSSYRNWDYSHCKDVLDTFNGIKIACVGLKSDEHIKGTIDLRGIPLSELVNIMSSSKVMIGPISGPTHLASLCGLSHVTWATKKEHEDRIKNTWNPFNTPSEVIIANDSVWHNRTKWAPSVGEITECVRKVLNEQTDLSIRRAESILLP